MLAPIHPAQVTRNAWKFEAALITGADGAPTLPPALVVGGTVYRDGIAIDTSVRFTGRLAFSVGPEVLRRAGSCRVTAC